VPQRRLISPALDADEFLRRYLLHVLPERFVRIRYFDFLANRVRTDNLALAREQLGPGSARAVKLRIGLLGRSVSSGPRWLDDHDRMDRSQTG
jgi:hypothetical protein